ncbi:MAG: hypothetical protein JW787_10575 [Sedimentisphaerales bacterium]|nr:hypothetical protein [Sedimentisphaerales bacterium]
MLQIEVLENMKSRLCDKPIVIDDWRKDETYEGIYPKGTRDKSAYFSPEAVDEKYLKGNYRYLFKLSRSKFPWQFWGEIIAYRLGLITGIEVPPAHIGLNNEYNPGEATYGALIEWFYDDKKDTYIEGGQIMEGIIKDYDRQKGTQHNFLSIPHFVKNSTGYWAGVFTLDCLIGNTDRHQDNWGLILKDAKTKKSKQGFVLFSPAFDNGTALGYEILEENIDKYKDEKLFEKYLTNPRHARHHMKWSLDQLDVINFYEFMKKFVLEFKDSKDIICKHLRFERSQVEEVMNPLVSAVTDNTYSLTQKRLHFIMELIFKRKKLLEKALGI